jgi:diguanylate cyclase (GGDEF)-like protein
LVLALVSAVASRFGGGLGPHSSAFIPVVATMWSLADLLTAFLLIGQFAYNGRVALGLLAAAYAFDGLLTWPYLSLFPGVLRAGAPLGDRQVSAYMWFVWHAAFALLVLGSVVADRFVTFVIPRNAIRRAVVTISAATVAAVSAFAALLMAYRDHLPRLVVGGHFQPLWSDVLVPAVILTNVLGCAALLLRRRQMTALSLWLIVSLLAASLDAILNLSATRYSYAWDTGKLITVVTSSTVLAMMLWDIVGLYGRLEREATVDVLTSLMNRRAFDAYLEATFGKARRTGASMAVLMIDVDHFKQYNDTYGHAAGDECLRRVAKALTESVTRPLDLVARYGGEEFVVVLPDTPVEGVLATAEHIRAAVERLEIDGLATEPGRTTVSVGAAFSGNAWGIVQSTLLEAADRAMYAAKRGGRNQVALGPLIAPAQPEPSNVAVPAAA